MQLTNQLSKAKGGWHNCRGETALTFRPRQELFNINSVNMGQSKSGTQRSSPRQVRSAQSDLSCFSWKVSDFFFHPAQVFIHIPIHCTFKRKLSLTRFSSNTQITKEEERFFSQDTQEQFPNKPTTESTPTLLVIDFWKWHFYWTRYH